MKRLHKVFILSLVLSLLGVSLISEPTELKTAEDIPFSWISHT